MPSWKLPKNYHLTLSRSETNEKDVLRVLNNNKDANVAVVFDKIPSIWNGRKVVSGDEHDLRILDPKGCIVGLKGKGQSYKDKTGFIVRLNVLQ